LGGVPRIQRQLPLSLLSPSLGRASFRAGNRALGLIYGRAMVPKARAWASGNKSTPCKANSRQKLLWGR
jgi:hypothetical protein